MVGSLENWIKDKRKALINVGTLVRASQLTIGLVNWVNKLFWQNKLLS